MNNQNFLAEDNSTYDLDKINASVGVPQPTEMTPEDFIMRGEGEQVAGPWKHVGKLINKITPDHYKVNKSVKQLRDDFRAEGQAKPKHEGMDTEDIESINNLQDDAPEGPYTGPEQNDLVGREEHRNINLSNINTSDDIKAVIDDMAQYQQGNVEATRGTITHEQTVAKAEDIRAIEQITGWKPGTAWNAEQVTAARQLLVNTASQVSVEAKRLMVDPRAASEADWANFARLQKMFSAMTSTVSGATAEAGRALSAHNIPISGNDRVNAINSILQESGGSELLRNKAKLIAEAGDMTEEQLAKLVNTTLQAPNQGVLAEVWINGMLSSPVTHSVNIVSNSTIQLMETYMVKPVAAAIGKARKAMGGQGDSVSFTEIEAETYGMLNSFGEAISLFGKRLSEKEGTDLFLTPSKTEMEHWNAFSSKRLLPATQHETSFARTVDFIGDWYVRLPGRFLESEDLFFKTITYRKELNAQAVRTAKSEGLEGFDYKRRVSELINSPNQQMNDAASTRADYETFTSDPAAYDSMFGNMTEAVTYLTSRHSSLKFIVPFVRTPSNIIRYAAENSIVSPVSAKWRADYKAGGAKKDMALARWSLGTMAYVSMLQLYDSGAISGSGPTDPASRKAMYQMGWQPNSVRIGDTYYSYNRSEPMGTAMGVMANVMDQVKFAKSDKDATVLMVDTILSMGQSFQDKTFMTSFAELFKALEGRESGAKAAAMYGNTIASNFVPAWVSLIAKSEDTIDGKEVRRDSNKFSKSYEGIWANLSKQIRNRTPGERPYLPAQRDWKGKIITKSGGGWADTSFFIERSEAKNDPATKMLLDNWVAPGVPSQVQTFIVPDAVTQKTGQTTFDIDLLDMDENGGHVYEMFQEYVGKRRHEIISKALPKIEAQGSSYSGNNSLVSAILESLLEKGLQIGKTEFYADYNKLAKQHGWREMDDQTIIDLIRLKQGEQGKKFPVPESPQGVTF